MPQEGFWISDNRYKIKSNIQIQPTPKSAASLCFLARLI
jgi:hypothetical protein